MGFKRGALAALSIALGLMPAWKVSAAGTDGPPPAPVGSIASTGQDRPDALPRGVLVRLVPVGRGEQDRESAAVYFVQEAAGEVYVAGDHGLCRMSGDLCLPMKLPAPATAAVNVVQQVGREVWVGTGIGLLRVEEDRLVAIHEQAIAGAEVAALASFDGATWVATHSGLVRFDSSGSTRLLSGEVVLGLLGTERALWVASMANAYRIDRSSSEPRPVFAHQTAISGLFEAGDQVWGIENRRGFSYCYRFEETGPRELPLPGEVLTVGEVEGEAWLGTVHGVARADGTTPIGVTLPRMPVRAVESLRQNEVWLGTARGVWVWSGSHTDALQEPDRRPNITGLGVAGGSIWAWSEDGAYRWDDGVEIVVRFAVVSGPGIDLMWGKTLRIDHVAYARHGRDPYRDGQVEEQFDLKFGCSSDDLHQAIWQSASSFLKELPIWCSYPQALVRDGFGNVRTIELEPILSSRWWWLPAVLPVVGFLVLLAAPAWRPAMVLLNMPDAIRDLGSLLSVRALLIFAFFRRHLLRRYVWNSAKASPCRDHLDAGALQDRAKELGGRASGNSLTVIEVEAADQRQVLQALKCQVARRSLGQRTLRKLSPIYLEVDERIKSAADLLKQVTDTLSGSGWITNENLATFLFRHGEFLVLIACGEKLPTNRRNALQEFVRAHAGNHVVIAVRPGVTTAANWPGASFLGPPAPEAS
jgi:hypothetical protein